MSDVATSWSMIGVCYGLAGIYFGFGRSRSIGNKAREEQDPWWTLLILPTVVAWPIAELFWFCREDKP